VFLRSLAAISVLTLLSGCGGGARSTSEPAHVFLERVLRQELSGRYDSAWDELYPAQQKRVAKDLFVRCQSRSPRTPVVRVKTLATRVEPIHRADVKETHWTAVRLGVVLDVGGQQTPLVHTFYAVKTGGGWRWLLDQAQVDVLAQGRCPGT
jgi:hypothetical protein